MGWGSTRSEPL